MGPGSGRCINFRIPVNGTVSLLTMVNRKFRFAFQGYLIEMSRFWMKDYRKILIIDLQSGILTLNNKVGFINFGNGILVVIIYKKNTACPGRDICKK